MIFLSDTVYKNFISSSSNISMSPIIWFKVYTIIQVCTTEINDFSSINTNTISTSITDDVIYCMSSSPYPHEMSPFYHQDYLRELPMYWNSSTSMRISLQWCYVHCKSFSTLAVMQ